MKKKITTLNDITSRKFFMLLGKPHAEEVVVPKKYKILGQAMGWTFMATLMLFGVAVILGLVVLITFAIRYLGGLF